MQSLDNRNYKILYPDENVVLNGLKKEEVAELIGRRDGRVRIAMPE